MSDWDLHVMPLPFDGITLQKCARCDLSWYPGIRSMGECKPKTASCATAPSSSDTLLGDVADAIGRRDLKSWSDIFAALHKLGAPGSFADGWRACSVRAAELVEDAFAKNMVVEDVISRLKTMTPKQPVFGVSRLEDLKSGNCARCGKEIAYTDENAIAAALAGAALACLGCADAK